MVRGAASVMAMVVATACTTVSHTGYFVRDIRRIDDKIAVTACDVELQVTETLDGKVSQLDDAGCVYARYDGPVFPPAQLEVPEGCEASVAAWHRQLRLDERLHVTSRDKVWQTLPRACRAYIEEVVQ
jgi:hypothetical protein